MSRAALKRKWKYNSNTITKVTVKTRPDEVGLNRRRKGQSFQLCLTGSGRCMFMKFNSILLVRIGRAIASSYFPRKLWFCCRKLVIDMKFHTLSSLYDLGQCCGLNASVSSPSPPNSYVETLIPKGRRLRR